MLKIPDVRAENQHDKWQVASYVWNEAKHICLMNIWMLAMNKVKQMAIAHMYLVKFILHPGKWKLSMLTLFSKHMVALVKGGSNIIYIFFF